MKIRVMIDCQNNPSTTDVGILIKALVKPSRSIRAPHRNTKMESKRACIV